jgi:hypothetical protein
VERAVAFAQLQLGFVDQPQWRYKLIRPLVLFADRTAQQRAQETETHPETGDPDPGPHAAGDRSAQGAL